MTQARLETLRTRLAASLKSDGAPLKGYTLRAAMLEAEIARLEGLAATARGDASEDPAGFDQQG